MNTQHPKLGIAKSPAVSPTRRGPSLTVDQIECAVRYALASAERQIHLAEFGGDARYHAGGADVLLALLAFITEQSPQALTLAVSTLVEERSS